MNHILINVADSPGQLGNFASEVLGIPGGNDSGPGLLRMVMSDQTVNSFGSYNYATRQGSTAFQGEDALIISKGKHIIHTGVQAWHTRQNLYYAGNNGAGNTCSSPGATLALPRPTSWSGITSPLAGDSAVR